MAEKTLNTRVVLKHDSDTNWAATGAAGKGANFVPKSGEVIVYEYSDGSRKFKIGNGKSTAAALPFQNTVGPTGPKGDKGATGAAATIAVGTVTTGAAGSSATVTNAGTSSAAKFNFTIPRGNTGAAGTRGSRWSTGTAVTGTSTTAAVFSGTGIADALVNDMYLNTSTGYIYRCTVAGAANVAKWVYEGSIKGPTPSTSDFASLTGSNTFTGYNTFKSPVYIQSTLEATSVEALKYISNSGSSEALYLPKNTTGTLALTKDIPTIEANPTASGTITLTKLKVGSTTYNIPSSGSGDVTAAGNNTFTGNNTFEGTVKVLGNNLYAKTLRVYWENEAQTKRNTLQLVPRNEDNGTEYSQFAIEDVDITAGTKKVLAINHGMIKQLNFTGVTTTSNGTLASSYNLTLPQKAGTLALTSDLDALPKLNSQNNFTGLNRFTNQIVFESALTSTNTSYYTNGISIQKQGASSYTLTYPSKGGTLALTEDIPIKAATLNGTILTLTI